MALSGSTDFNLTAREVITFALQKLNVKDRGGTLKPADAEAARIQLNLMLKSWQVHGPHLWKKAEASVTLVAGVQSYALQLGAAVNPLRIISARYRSASGQDTPMESLTRDDYFNLPNKASVGTPTQYYFDPQRGSQAFYIWCVPASVTTETIQYTYQKRLDDIDDLANDIDVPQEWLETVGYGLAARLVDDYGIADRVADRIIARAEQLHRMAMDYEREDTVMICAGEDW